MDLHEVLSRYNVNKLIDLHRQRFEWTHDEALIRKNFTNFDEAENDLEPICLKNKEWIFIKEDFEEAVKLSIS